MLKKIMGCTCGAFILAVGAALLFFGLMRLGWRRHGAHPLDFSFLHLDWILQPDLPYWSAHMNNLGVVFIACLLILSPLVVGAWYLRRKHR